MAEQPSGERTEEATPRRKEEARKKGTVARSQDVAGAAGLLVIAGMAPGVAAAWGAAMVGSMTTATLRQPDSLTPATVTGNIANMALPMALSVLPLLAAILVAGLVANFAQVGFVLSGEPMAPKFEKIDPFKGVKRLFSRRALGEGIKATLKLGLFSLIAGLTLWNARDTLGLLSALPTGQAAAVIGHLAQTILVRIALTWVAIAGLDYFFQRKETDKQLKMTKDELRREMKEQEGSPEFKGARMRRARELSKGGLGSRVKSADVIITNPTHYAVAVAYERSKMAAPVVVAKGQDILALRIRELAKENKIPIVENRPLARALHKQCEVGDAVPRELFAPVAEVLAYVYRTLKRTAR